jgi:hypothetical protein
VRKTHREESRLLVPCRLLLVDKHVTDEEEEEEENE